MVGHDHSYAEYLRSSTFRLCSSPSRRNRPVCRRVIRAVAVPFLAVRLGHHRRDLRSRKWARIAREDSALSRRTASGRVRCLPRAQATRDCRISGGTSVSRWPARGTQRDRRQPVAVDGLVDLRRQPATRTPTDARCIRSPASMQRGGASRHPWPVGPSPAYAIDGRGIVWDVSTDGSRR